MRKWLKAHPMWVLLVPMVGLILLCRYTEFPFSLTADTDCIYLDSLRTYRATVTDYPTPRRKTWRVEVKILSTEDSVTEPLHIKAHLYIARDSVHQPENIGLGDTLLVRTRVRRAGMLDRFDYGEYLRLQGVAGTGYVPARGWRCIGHADTRWNPKAWQHALYDRLARMDFAPRELGTLAALTLGYKEDIDPTVKRQFQTSGAAHVLAVSGLHTGIVYSIIWCLLTCFGLRKPLYEERGKRIVVSLLLIGALWGYALITGMTPSVVRSVLMLTIAQVGYMCYRQGVSLNTLAAAAILILAFRPRDLFSVSFQLSFAAVAGILCIMPVLKWSNLVPMRKMYHRFVYTGWNYTRDMILVTLAAWLGTAPLTMYYFGYCSNYFLPTSMVVLPLAWFAVVGGLSSLAIGTIPYVGTAVVWLTEKVIWLMNSVVGWIDALPGSTTAIRLSPSMIVVLYVAIITGLLSLKRSLWWLIGFAGSLGLFAYLYSIV